MFGTQTQKELMVKAVSFILLHRVCFSSHTQELLLHKGIERLTFPNMYHSDFLEILWILAKADCKSDLVADAVKLLQAKINAKGVWTVEKQVKNLVLPIGKIADECITGRAREVLEYYGSFT